MWKHKKMIHTTLLSLTGEDAICTLYQKEIEYKDGTSVESWSCQFTKQQVAKMEESIQDLYGSTYTGPMQKLIVDAMMMDITAGIENDEMEQLGIVSGTAILKLVEGSTLLVEHTGVMEGGVAGNDGSSNINHDSDELTVSIPEDSKYTIEELASTDCRHYKACVFQKNFRSVRTIRI